MHHPPLIWTMKFRFRWRMTDRIVHHAKRWLNGPMPADLMADLADILEDDQYTTEKRVHQIVWQAFKWSMANPPKTAQQENEK